MAKNDNAWTRSLSRINLKIIFLQNYQFFMNYAKGPVKIHWLEAEKITFDPWRNFRIASLDYLLFSPSFFLFINVFSVPFTCKNKVSIWRKMLLWEEKHDFVFLTNFQPFPAGSKEAASKDSLSPEPSDVWTLLGSQYNKTK